MSALLVKHTSTTTQNELHAAYDALLRRDGLPYQIVITFEEFSELAIELSRNMRKRKDSAEDIAEEMADCLIVMDKMCHYAGITAIDIQAAIERKTKKIIDKTAQLGR